MRGTKKDKVNLSEQGVVTEEALMAYLHNELSPEEKQELEKLLLEDPFAADALEGLKSSANQAIVTSSVSSLKKKVRDRSGLKERKKLELHWVTFAWAAVLIGLLIGIGFMMVNFLNKDDNQNMAMKEKNEVVKTPVLKPMDNSAVSGIQKITPADSLAHTVPLTLTDIAAHAPGAAVVQTRPVGSTSPGAVEVKGSTAPTSGYAYTVNSTTVASLNDAGNAKSADKGPVDKNKSVKPAANTDSLTVSNYATSRNAPLSKAETLKKEAKPDTKDIAGLQDDAMKSFNAGDYNTAADAFDKILKSESDNADALYFGGISDYINGKTNKSEINFDKLLKKGNKYMEGSKWYKANILLKKGKSDAAKVLLQDLSNSNGSYKERAIKKLAEMGF